jgi:hypothetical protein
MMSVAVTRSGGTIEFGLPAPLFKTRTPSSGRTLGTYDVTPDGQRFLVGELLGEASNAIPAVILNWPAIVQR